MDEELATLFQMNNPNDFRWVKVKKHTKNINLSTEDQLKSLEDHHIQETSFLINECRRLASLLLKEKGY